MNLIFAILTLLAGAACRMYGSRRRLPRRRSKSLGSLEYPSRSGRYFRRVHYRMTGPLDQRARVRSQHSITDEDGAIWVLEHFDNTVDVLTLYGQTDFGRPAIQEAQLSATVAEDAVCERVEQR